MVQVRGAMMATKRTKKPISLSEKLKIVNKAAEGASRADIAKEIFSNKMIVIKMFLRKCSYSKKMWIWYRLKNKKKMTDFFNKC